MVLDQRLSLDLEDVIWGSDMNRPMDKAVLQSPSCVHYWCVKDGFTIPDWCVSKSTHSDSNRVSTFNTPAGDSWDLVMLSNPENVTVFFQELKNYV